MGNRTDNLLNAIKDWTENITYGEMKDIAKDNRKMKMLEDLYKELSSLLNDIDIISKEKKHGK